MPDTQMKNWELEVEREPLSTRAAREAWDELLSRSESNTVFLSSPWLRAWMDTLGRDSEVIAPTIRHQGKLVAAALFEAHDGLLRFAGHPRSDYADFLVDKRLNDAGYRHAVQELMACALQTSPSANHFELNRVPTASRTYLELQASSGPFYTTEIGAVPAPRMHMSVVQDRLAKKSLKRHDRGLRKLGEVTCSTTTDATLALQDLDEFFQQHIQRWAATDTPSLFNEPSNRDFYRAVAKHLGEAGHLRFTTVRIDDKLAAAHFGFMHDGVFTWYKPSFDPQLAKQSPGEVLLKRLLERACNENATWFDFTIGGEAFKMRFATDVETVANLHATGSRGAALLRRLRKAVRARLDSRRRDSAEV